MVLTAIARARDILRRKDETIYDSHAFIYPLLAELILEIETLRCQMDIYKEAINDGRPV